ncbi:MAG: penicillin-binding protein 2 [Thermodesulfobacteriota bacterium]|nr:penicillin-binding protein 2 [Thermodesulfobacteriota bacterium]
MFGNQDRLTDYDPGKYRKKIQVIIWLVFFVFFTLIARLWYLQVVRGADLGERSENNRVRIREIKPLRGLIMDTNGDTLVDNQSSFDISIIPEAARDMEDVLAKLANLCDLGEVSASGKEAILKSGKPFVPVRIYKDIDRDMLAVVETNLLKLPGVVVDVVPVREYIYGEMMAHILGYVGNISSAELERDSYSGYKHNDIVGKYGIEKYLNRYLKGESGGEQVEVDVAGRRLNVLGSIRSVLGYNVVLNIDVDLQKICWDAFQEKAGTMIVMDPRTGYIMALINKPSFDPNCFNRGISGKNWEKLTTNPLCPLQNRAISGQYPPGSTYKMIVAAAALEEGLITENTKIFCDGTYRMGDRTFRCWKEGGHGMMNLHQAIVQSCDVYFYHIGEMLGVDKIAEYSEDFGLGYKTGISLPGEKTGLIPTKEWKLRRYGEAWQKGETTSLSIGQGLLLATPLQLLRAYCAIANGGILYKPRLIKEIKASDGQVIREFSPEQEKTVSISRKNIEILIDALWGVVNESNGTGGALKRKEKDVCGKTGTAQVISMQDDTSDKVDDTPYKFRDHALFVCFAPYKNPTIAILVIVEHGGHGGSVAAPIARRVIDGYFNLKRKEQRL